MQPFPWLEKLTDLAAESTPDGWELLERNAYIYFGHGQIWRSHRIEKSNRYVDLYVDLRADIPTLSNTAQIEISAWVESYHRRFSESGLIKL